MIYVTCSQHVSCDIIVVSVDIICDHHHHLRQYFVRSFLVLRLYVCPVLRIFTSTYMHVLHTEQQQTCMYRVYKYQSSWYLIVSAVQSCEYHLQQYCSYFEYEVRSSSGSGSYSRTGATFHDRTSGRSQFVDCRQCVSYRMILHSARQHEQTFCYSFSLFTRV